MITYFESFWLPWVASDAFTNLDLHACCNAVHTTGTAWASHAVHAFGRPTNTNVVSTACIATGSGSICMSGLAMMPAKQCCLQPHRLYMYM